MTMLAIDKVALENVAQWLEARGDPMQSAQEIRALVAAAKPSADPELAERNYKFILTHGSCTCGTRDKNQGTCAFCVIRDDNAKARKP